MDPTIQFEICKQQPKLVIEKKKVYIVKQYIIVWQNSMFKISKVSWLIGGRVTLKKLSL